MTDQIGATAPSKRKNKGDRLYVRLSHKQDLQVWDELCERPEYRDADASEILRQGLRGLADAHRVSDQLEGYEKRMSGSMKALHRRFDQLEGSMQINMAFLEVLMRTYYYHTNPVPKEAAPQAVADANRRIDRFIEDVAGMLQKGGAMQDLAIRVIDRDEGMRDGSGG